MFDLSASSIFAQVFWSGVGLAFLVYGKKQSEWAPLLGGLAILAITYFISSAVLLSLVGAALTAGIFWWRRRP